MEKVRSTAKPYNKADAVKIAKGLGNGLRLRFAAARAGISLEDAHAWETENGECQILFDAARGKWIESNLNEMKGERGSGWQQQAWLIERTNEEYAQPRAPAAAKSDAATGTIIIETNVPRPPDKGEEPNIAASRKSPRDLIAAKKEKEKDDGL